MPAESTTATSVDFEQEWASFKLKFAKCYQTPEEESRRFQIFQDNLRRKIERKRPLHIGAFADLTWQEYSSKYLPV
ncbi:hypothetical protein D910_06100 [Dendroctonus ponderosae]